MKKILISMIIIATMLSFVACGNRQIFDFEYAFDEAIVKMPDGEVLTIEISKWKDYDGEQLQIIAKDGTVYLVSSFNCVLIKR